MLVNAVSIFLGLIFFIELRSLMNQVRLLKESRKGGLSLKDLMLERSRFNIKTNSLTSFILGVYCTKTFQTITIILRLILIIACLCCFIIFYIFLGTDYGELLKQIF